MADIKLLGQEVDPGRYLIAVWDSRRESRAYCDDNGELLYVLRMRRYSTFVACTTPLSEAEQSEVQKIIYKNKKAPEIEIR